MPQSKSAKSKKNRTAKTVKPSTANRKKIGTANESAQAKKPIGFKGIYRQVKRIPKGKVSTYGDIALFCDESISARTVGWALNVAPKDVPWHRVLNSTGWLSVGRRSLLHQQIQRDLLLSEGVEFTDEFTVDLERFRWRPRQKPNKLVNSRKKTKAPAR